MTIYVIRKKKSFLCYLPSPNVGFTPPGLTSQIPVSVACRGSNRRWTRILDKNIMANLPEYVVSTILGPPPETIQDRTRIKDTHPVPEYKLKFLNSSRIKPGPLGWKAETLPTTPRRRTKNKERNVVD